MGELIPTNSPQVQSAIQSLKNLGWRVEWNGERNVCYKPSGDVAFEYGTTPQEYDGAWAYLVHWTRKKPD